MFKYRLFAQSSNSGYSSPTFSIVIVTETALTEEELNEEAIEWMYNTVQPGAWFEELDPDDPAEEGDA